jgi:hypothetical protein
MLSNQLPMAPTPNHIMRTKSVAFLIILLAFSVLVYVGSVSYTGFAINEPESSTNNQNILLSSQFEVLEVHKSPNSVISLELNSDLNLNIFSETNDCEHWLSGKDRDNTVLYAVNSINSGNFRIGDPSTKTIQQIELYKTDYMCLILINRDYPNSGNVNLKYSEVEKDKWTIV